MNSTDEYIEKFKNQVPYANIYLDEDYDYIEEEDELFDIATEIYNCDINYNHGISKFVIIPDKFNYVIKMPIGRVYHNSYIYDSAIEDYIETDDPESEYIESDYDYCSKEVEIYNLAKQAKLEFLFAETVYCGDAIGGLSIYKQEKIRKFLDNKRNTSKKALAKASEIISSSEKCHKLSSVWLGTVIDLYGVEVANEFIRFCEVNYINDLHEGNVGFRDNGEPVLIDYSGYFS